MGIVYFVQSGEAVKIGFTTNMPLRLRHLRSANPYPVVVLGTIPGSVGNEQALHARFTHLRLHGEWYNAVPELLQAIAGLMQPTAPTSHGGVSYANVLPYTQTTRQRRRFGRHVLKR